MIAALLIFALVAISAVLLAWWQVNSERNELRAANVRLMDDNRRLTEAVCAKSDVSIDLSTPTVRSVLAVTDSFRVKHENQPFFRSKQGPALETEKSG